MRIHTIWALSASSMLAVGIIGILHLPVARPLLSWMGVGCPLKAAPADVEAARLSSGRAIRGEHDAPERPALGFDLGLMTRTDVDAWAERWGVGCTASLRGAVLRCEGVPADRLGQAGAAIDDVTFAFTPDTQRLVTVTTLRNQLDAGEAAIRLTAIEQSLAARLGPARTVGEASAEYLLSGPMRTAQFEYRFKDYLATVTATHLGPRVVLREHYMFVD